MNLIRKVRFQISYRLAWLARKFSEAGYIQQNAEITGIGHIRDYRKNGEQSVVQFVASQYKMEKVPNSPAFCWVDVGANVGKYSDMVIRSLERFVPGSSLSGYLFEPQKNAQLNENLAMWNKSYPNAHIDIHYCGAGSANEKKKIYVQRDNESGTLASSMHEIISHHLNDEHIEEKEMNVVRLDTFFNEHQVNQIHLLKIDTEGYEKEVLEGCGAYLTPSKIRAIQFEFNYTHAYRKQFLKDFHDLLHPKGYHLFRLNNNKWTPLTPYNPEQEIFQYQNILAISSTLNPLN